MIGVLSNWMSLAIIAAQRGEHIEPDPVFRRQPLHDRRSVQNLREK
jgi:hypothetical protein